MKCGPILMFAVCVAAQASTVPAGTELAVRLTTEVSSDKPSGQSVTGVLTAPVFVDGTLAIGAGARLQGSTADAVAAKAADGQTAEQAATLRIQFTRLIDQAGHSQDLSCVLTEVDNARETVNDTGLIVGISSSKTYEGMLDQGLGKLSGDWGSLLSGIKGSLLKQVDPSIDYKPGVDLTFKLTKALNWNAPARPSNVSAIAPADALAALINVEPYRTAAQKPPKPSDLTNLMFIGSEQQLQEAFHEAGWFTAAELSANSKMETARAIIEDRGYSEAPVSVLFLDARPPDMTFQKQNDTFDKRHHIRIWGRPEQFNGQAVWVAAATHDTGVTFSRVSHNFTHGIDSNIDTERSKVVNDLLFTGKVKAIALVERPAITGDLSNATGDTLKTDRKMAVLEF